MTEELPCGCLVEVWLPRLGAPTPPDGERRIVTAHLECTVHQKKDAKKGPKK